MITQVNAQEFQRRYPDDGPVLYSTNALLKYMVCKRYRNDRHHVWCSPCFDSSTRGEYDFHRLIPPSSSPADIYRRLLEDVVRNDEHSYKIAEQRASLSKLALDWSRTAEINEATAQEIIGLADLAKIDLWRPLIYVIPRTTVESKMSLVPLKDRAGPGPEYIIADLCGSEFDRIELRL